MLVQSHGVLNKKEATGAHGGWGTMEFIDFPEKAPQDRLRHELDLESKNI